jgi:LexA-binding, inner membrane-associated putative hydrolase
MSVGLQRRVVPRSAELMRVLQLATGLLVIWLGALELQERSAPGQLTWAALDIAVHGAAAGLCAVWLLPGYGWRPLASAIAAGILIDLDHAVAARSLDPLNMMSIGARPPTHSLLAAVLFGIVAGRLLGAVCGYAVAIGMLAHLLGDAVEPPGVPLLVPFVANPTIQVPAGMLIGGMLAMALTSAWLTQRARPRRDGRLG